MGPRIYTLFLYLSDVEEGGETEFPSLGLRVTPRKGAAVLWPSVSDSDPDRRNDIRTMHQALPVIKGLKYAANIWIHMYDYKTQWHNDCTG
jgi:prolyl 4-hydroxylase